MRNFLLFVFFVALGNLGLHAAELTSPDGSVKVGVTVSDRIYYSIYRDNVPLIEKASLRFEVEGQFSARQMKISSSKISQLSRTLNPVVPMKFSTIKDQCNMLLIQLDNGYSVEFRAYNEGAAYRIVTHFKSRENEKVKVVNEAANLNLADSYLLHVQPAKDFTSNYETNYIHLDAQKWRASNQLATLPALIDTKKGYKVLFGETDVRDYPC
ncbi:MAG: glycoside hydrolase family 97 protein, partial [Sphingobacteriales bacterium]